jgi:DNA-binding beta-propeller fold protein YncE
MRLRRFITACAALPITLIGCAHTAKPSTESSTAQFSNWRKPTGVLPVDRIALPTASGYSFPSLDVRSRRLYVPTGNTLDVVDIDRRTVVGHIASRAEIRMAVAVPESGIGFMTREDDSVSVFDLATLTIRRTASASGGGPDPLVYDQAAKRVFVFNEYTPNIAIFDAKTGDALGTLALPAIAGYGVPDGHGSMYVTIKKPGMVVRIDTRRLKVDTSFVLANCRAAHGIAIDLASGRLFVGCAQHVSVIDSRSGTVLDTLPVRRLSVQLAYDTDTRTVLMPDGRDSLLFARQVSPTHYAIVARAWCYNGSYLVAADPSTHTAFVPYAGDDPDNTSGGQVMLVAVVPY